MWGSVSGYGGGEGRGMGGVGKVRGDAGGVKKCEGRYGRVYGVSVVKCVGVWGKGMEGLGGGKERRVEKKCGEGVGECMG